MEAIICTNCKQPRTFEEMAKDSRRKRGHGSWCKQCIRDHHRAQDPAHVKKRTKAWRDRNPERQKQIQSASARRQHEAAKREVVAAYGGVCTCCGEADIHFLTVEHLTEESSKRHRYENGKRIGGTKLLRMIAREGFPDDITVLCFNCNCGRGQYGICPHKMEGNPFLTRYAT